MLTRVQYKWDMFIAACSTPGVGLEAPLEGRRQLVGVDGERLHGRDARDVLATARPILQHHANVLRGALVCVLHVALQPHTDLMVESLTSLLRYVSLEHDMQVLPVHTLAE